MRLPALLPALFAAALVPAQEPSAPPPRADLVAALAHLVDLPDPAARMTEAQRLAARRDASLDEWLLAAAALPPRLSADDPLRQPGVHQQTTELFVANAMRPAEIVVRVPKPAHGAPPAGPMPLLLVGHGTGGSGDTAWQTWAALADRLGLLLGCPTEPYEPYRTAGWAYQPDARQEVLQALRWLRRHYDVDENRVVLTGYSRGGHMTWDIATRYPDLFSGLIPACGAPRLGNAPHENNMRYLENVAALPIRDLQGLGDDAMMLANLRRAFDVLKLCGARDAVMVPFPDLGHDFRLDGVDWDAFFQHAVRTRPQRIVRLPALDEAPIPPEGRRAAWIEVLTVDPKVHPKWPMQVSQSRWAQLDEQGKRDHVDSYLRDNTPRLEVQQDGPGRFVARGRGVRSFRLLLLPDMLTADGKVTVQWNNRTRTEKPTPSPRVLLAEFAERFDRSFLPVAEVIVK